MRFDDVGDYNFEIASKGHSGNNVILKIYVAEMGNEKYEFLVALHEFIESYLLYLRGADFQGIDEWENQFTKETRKGLRPENAIAGEQEDCPYKDEHRLAIEVEKMVAKYLGVNWEEYEKYLDELIKNKRSD